MPEVKATTFTGAPTDKLEAVDVYGQRDDEKRNKFTGAVNSAFKKSIQDSLGSLTRKIRTVGNQISRGSLTADQAQERLLGNLTGSRSEINRISTDFKKELVTKMTGSRGLASRIRVGDDFFELPSVDLSNARAVQSFMTDLTGQDLFETMDYGADVAIFDTTLNEVIKWGAPVLVGAVMNELNNDKQKRRDVVRSASRNFANAGDLDSVEELLNHVSASDLTVNRPDFPRLVISQFRFKAGQTPANYPAILTQMVNVMDQLKFDWFETQRDSETVYNLGILRYASDDARILLQSSDTYRTAVSVAQYYPESPYRSLVRSMYPKVAFVA